MPFPETYPWWRDRPWRLPRRLSRILRKPLDRTPTLRKFTKVVIDFPPLLLPQKVKKGRNRRRHGKRRSVLTPAPTDVQRGDAPDPRVQGGYVGVVTPQQVSVPDGGGRQLGAGSRVVSVPRIRKITVPHRPGGTVVQTGGFTYEHYDVLWEWLYDELAVSEGHSRRRRGAWSGGGPFFAWHASIRHRNGLDLSFVRWGNKTKAHLVGVFPVSSYFWGDHPNPNDVRPSFSAEKQIAQAWGPTAFARTRPDAPGAGFGQFLGELHQLPQVPFKGLVRWPKIRSLAGVPFKNWGKALYNRLREYFRLEGRLGAREFLQQARRGLKPGGEYLNVVFGWQPFLRDLVSAYELSLVIDDELKKLIKESGKGIHRRKTLERQREHTDMSQGTAAPFTWVTGNAYAPGGLGVMGSSTHHAQRVREVKVWFAGKYRYWIPENQLVPFPTRAKAALYGVLPTPSLVWELLPMSWLLDWFTNFGDVIANVSTGAVDNLVLEYGFIMRHVTEKITASVDVRLERADPYVPGYNAWDAVTHRFESEYHFDSKSRAGFNPFFPGSQPWVFEPASLIPPFTAKQWAILAALGLSQGINR